MPYMINVHPDTRIDLMLRKPYWPKMAGAFERIGCTYSKEIMANEYVILQDVRAIDGKGMKGSRNVGELIGIFYAMEWSALTAVDNGESEEAPMGQQNFYILVRPRKKGKKYVQKNRAKAGSGSEGRDAGEPGDIQSGEDPEHCGGWNQPADSGPGSSEQLGMFDAQGNLCCYQ